MARAWSKAPICVVLVAAGCRMVNPAFDGAQGGTAETTVTTASEPATSTTSASVDSMTSGDTSTSVLSFGETTTEESSSDTGSTTGGTSDCMRADTGWVSPTLEHVPGAGDGFEGNPQGAFADGGDFASNIDSPGDNHIYYGFDLGIPQGCAVRGVETRVDWWSSHETGASDLRVALSADAGSTWHAEGHDTELTLAEHTVEFGSPISRGGSDWSGVDLQGDSVRVRLRTRANGVNPSSDTFVDWVAVRVHYGDPVIETGPLAPTAQEPRPTGDGDGFEVTPTGAFVQGGDAAQDIRSGLDGSGDCDDLLRDGHRFHDFGFGVPAGSVVHGLSVRADAWVDNNNQDPRMCFRMSWDGGAEWTAAETVDLSDLPQIFALGADDFTWGRLWDAADLSDENFRLEVSTLANNANRDFLLDYVTVDVAYDDP